MKSSNINSLKGLNIKSTMKKQTSIIIKLNDIVILNWNYDGEPINDGDWKSITIDDNMYDMMYSKKNSTIYVYGITLHEGVLYTNVSQYITIHINSNSRIFLN